MNGVCQLVAVLAVVTSFLSLAQSTEDPSSFDHLFSRQACPEHCSGAAADRRRSGVRIFYLVLIHNERTARDALHLFRSIRDPRNTIVFHYDTRASDLHTVLDDEIAACSCGAVVRRESVHTVEWSKWSMNLPTLWGMELAVNEYENDWDVFINLSGDTLAVYEPQVMAHQLQALPYNFVTSRSCETGLFPTPVYDFPKVWHKRRHYTVDETESDAEFVDGASGEKVVVTIHFGSQWVILQRDFVKWIVAQRKDPKSWVAQFAMHLERSGKLMTDETFVPTLLMHAPEHYSLPKVNSLGRLLLSNGTASSIEHVRFERMDEHYPTAFGSFPEDQRYQVPNELLHVVDQPRVWGPYFLGTYSKGVV